MWLGNGRKEGGAHRARRATVPAPPSDWGPAPEGGGVRASAPCGGRWRGNRARHGARARTVPLAKPLRTVPCPDVAVERELAMLATKPTPPASAGGFFLPRWNRLNRVLGRFFGPALTLPPFRVF